MYVDLTRNNAAYQELAYLPYFVFVPLFLF